MPPSDAYASQYFEGDIRGAANANGIVTVQLWIADRWTEPRAVTPQHGGQKLYAQLPRARRSPKHHPPMKARSGICERLATETKNFLLVNSHPLDGGVAFFHEKCVSLAEEGWGDFKRGQGNLGSFALF